MHTDNTYRYGLKHYHRHADKPACPACGKNHKFSEYIDLRTGQPVGPGVGKCERINHCQYHVTPSEYFSQHPEARYGYHSQATPVFKPRPEEVRHYLPDTHLEPYTQPYTASALGRWLQTKAPSAEALERVAKTFSLTANLTQGIIFWYIDHTGRRCQGKMAWYSPDGHRTSSFNTVSSDMAKRRLLPEGIAMQQCLYGAQQLPHRPTDTAIIVESEKTAIVMSMLQPQYVWLATGGCSGLNTYVVRPLFGRRVVLIPDSGCLEKWQKVMAKTKSIDYTFYTKLEEYPPNTDILDIMLPH